MSLNALASLLKRFSIFFGQQTHRHEGIALPLLHMCARGNNIATDDHSWTSDIIDQRNHPTMLQFDKKQIF